MKRKRFFAVGVLGLSVLALAGHAFADANADLEKARDASAAFQRVGAAEAAGYGRLVDAAGIACIEQPGLGAMGIHYVNGSLVGDAILDPARPEALVYEPSRFFGHLRLVALEYIVFKSVWEAAGNTSPPSLFGTRFDFTDAPNRYGIPPFYALHAWIWKPNPAGLFMPWNPRVNCP